MLPLVPAAFLDQIWNTRHVCSIVRGNLNGDRRMNPRDLLGVAIRAFGLWLCFRALTEIFAVLLSLRRVAGALMPPAEGEAFAAFYAVVGLFLILLADHIVHLLYGDRRVPPGEV
jgi:hypothetical protein